MAQFQVNGFTVVAGASGGIGKEVALTFASAGARGVLFADIDYEGATRAAGESNGLATNPAYRSIAVKLDVTIGDSVTAMVEVALKEFGRIDYFINAVGVDVAEYVPFEQTTDEDYDRVLGINTRGAYLLSKAVVKAMKSQEPAQVDLGRHGVLAAGRGSIVNLCSAMSLGAVAGKTAYTTSKHAMLGLTRACAMDCKAYDIRVNQVSPAWVRTPIFEEECRRVPEIPAIVEKVAARKQPMEPYEIASACLYLCSPGAVSITGTNLVMDCGLTIGPAL
ncbi:NAD(P)-binding protein [Xylaria intraflava]|nr:NAD(P)-binding protein [Xylaria intraflava]